MAVVDGRAEIYLHAGGQYQWDNCAPAAVAGSKSGEDASAGFKAGLDMDRSGPHATDEAQDDGRGLLFRCSIVVNIHKA